MTDFAASARIRDGGGTVSVVDLSGQLDGSAVEAMEQAYAEATRTPTDALVLDFDRVDYINSTGIALVVGLLARARAEEVEVRVCGLSDHYRHIFEITRLADFVVFFDDGPAAVAGSPSA